LGALRRIVFVIDSDTVSKKTRDVAELLYDVLVAIRSSNTPLLVVCNKQDLDMVSFQMFRQLKTFQCFQLLILGKVEQGNSQSVGKGTGSGVQDSKRKFGEHLGHSEECCFGQGR
jgi:signal recognition particle receptor subunit beta